MNKSKKYHQAKAGVLVDGIFSEKDIHDCICGLILFYLKSIKEENYLPNIKIEKLQQQQNYRSVLQEIKNRHYHKISYKDKKVFLMIFMTLELLEKNQTKRVKI